MKRQVLRPIPTAAAEDLPSRKKPRMVATTPLRTPTTVVVSAELYMVHRNRLKLRRQPMMLQDASSRGNPDMEPSADAHSA